MERIAIDPFAPGAPLVVPIVPPDVYALEWLTRTVPLFQTVVWVVGAIIITALVTKVFQK